MGGPPPHGRCARQRCSPGRVVYLVLNREQKRALRDPEGSRARRAPAPARSSTSTTPGALPARGAGVPGGRAQARLRRRPEALQAHGETAACRRRDRQVRPLPAALPQLRDTLRLPGALYKLGHRLLGARLSTKRKRPVGKRKPVKANFHVPWWRHPLFGDLLGLPPPEISRHDLRRMKTLDERFESPR